MLWTSLTLINIAMMLAWSWYMTKYMSWLGFVGTVCHMVLAVGCIVQAATL